MEDLLSKRRQKNSKKKINVGLINHKLNERVLLKKRDYYIYIPSTSKPLSVLPIYIVLHGGFSNAREIMSESRFNVLAEEKEFIVVYPNAAYGVLGKLQHWNAGFCCGKAQKDNLNDLDFLLNVLSDLREKYNLRSNDIYLIGFSNGGMLAYRFAAVYGEMLKGLAVVSASAGSRLSSSYDFDLIPKPKTKLPIIVFHGKLDKSIPYDGGRTRHHKTKREYISVKESLDIWKSLSVFSKKELTRISKKIERYRYYDEDNSIICELYSIEEWGHKWPNISKEFNASNLIHSFFERN